MVKYLKYCTLTPLLPRELYSCLQDYQFTMTMWYILCHNFNTNNCIVFKEVPLAFWGSGDSIGISYVIYIGSKTTATALETCITYMCMQITIGILLNVRHTGSEGG